MNIYEAADNAIRQMNRRNLKAFDRLKLMKRDELHIIREVSTVYDDSAKDARTRYYEIATEAYIIAMIQAHKTNAEATRMVDKDITMDWIEEYLEETDYVTLYRFDTETERKKQRMIEALAATQEWDKEIDKALRYWTLQVGQYAINITDRARLLAFKRAGIKRVKWVTKHDERVCGVCDERDEKIFDIDKVPTKHINCRCHLLPVFG